MNEEAIRSTVESLKYIYTIILALSMTEAFKKVISDRDGSIHWDRMFNLVPFLFLIIPFFQGMNRHLTQTFQSSSRPSEYGGYLLFHCAVFTIESILFFVLARSLPLEFWKRFYGAVAGLLLLDIFWGVIVWQLHTVEVRWWVITNIFAIAILALVWHFAKNNSMKFTISMLWLIVVLRAIVDYSTSWKLYFPD